MKKILLSLILLGIMQGFAQLQIDTLALQTFDTTAQTVPVWSFTGPVVYNSGTSGASAAPANSPIGIGGSRAWESTLQSSGLVLTFSNITVAPGYDSVRVHFNLAAMNLTGSTGGPDNLDYVLTEVSTDAGFSYYGRLRIRGAVANNSFWPYAATGVAKVYYQPQTEVVFAPANSGLQTTEGYSNNEIVFPGSVTQVMIRMTGRSSTSTDTWLVDNVVITGEKPGTTHIAATGLSNYQVYPNPAQGNLYIHAQHAAQVALVDMLGKEVLSSVIEAGRNEIAAAGLANGIYTLKLSNKSGTSYQRIVIDK